MPLIVLLLAALVGCAHAPAPAGLVEIHREDAPGAVAHFGRPAAEPPEPGAPPELTVTALWFTFPGDGKAYLFRPSGTLYFSDWRFGVFSPGGRHALLLQDRFGPYHVVATRRLRDYLRGRAAPDEVLRTEAGAGALVHGKARWLSPDELSYEAAGETPIPVRHRLRPAPR